MTEQTRYRPWKYERPPYGAFGQIATIGERLVCHLCGRDFLNLQTHAWSKHELSAREYKDTFLLRRETPLWATSVSRKLSRSNERRMRSDPEHLDQMTTAARKVKRTVAPLSPATVALKSSQMRERANLMSADERKSLSRRMTDAQRRLWRDDPEWRERRSGQISAYQRGRKHPWAKSGEESTNPKLTWAKVRRIRELAANGRSYSAIAADVPGATRSNVHLIVKGETWIEA